MRVLILPSFYPTEDEPNRGIFFQQQAQLCVRDDVEIHVLFYELRSLKKLKALKNLKNFFQTKGYQEKNLLVYRCHAWNIIPTQYKLGTEIWINASFRLFQKYVSEYGLPDFIHVQSAFAAGKLAYLINKRYNLPYFINEHASSVKFGKFSVEEIENLKKYYNKAYCVVAVSEPFKNLIAERFSINANHIRVIPNFIDVDFFKPPVDSEPQSSTTLFLTVCFLEKKKGLDRLIDAFYEMFKGNMQVKLTIGGEGPMKPVLIKQIEKYQLQDQITMLGALSQQAVKEQMGLCSSFVLTSNIETFGVVLIEAMAMGKPVVATRSGGPEDFVTEDVGILAENNPDAVKDALLTMSNGFNKYNKGIIRKYIVDNFSASAVSDKVIALYKEIKDWDQN
ncbi:glycosyltransferase [Mucilaginibacter sp. FT3.2]|uniref:glycosyltransferase n=1 Tax=Mucilaginibacter sp. FT3.2 TaxID=2723090 RepID=UPI00161AFBA7|nr:glycosyltransferase [Mucilaginibacter sp. FT3.2]MBB6230165.1 glycosyltransferase involved in cell wall biosynthesis [Mucilaginibacter sp. FT3.2]